MAPALRDSITSGHRAHFATPSHTETFHGLGNRTQSMQVNSLNKTYLDYNYPHHLISQAFTREDLIYSFSCYSSRQASQYVMYSSPTHLCSMLQICTVDGNGWSSTGILCKWLQPNPLGFVHHHHHSSPSFPLAKFPESTEGQSQTVHVSHT